MKRIVFGSMAVLTAVLLVMGCVTSRGMESSTPRQAQKANVKWDNDSAGYLTVNNDIDANLILFAGSINNRNILGGVNKLESRRVDYFDKLSDSSGTFLLRAVKDEVYRAKGSNLGSDDIVYAGLVTFDKNEPRQSQVNILKTLGGDAVIILQNDTNMAMEIRLERPDGPTLTTLAPLERNKKVYMEPNGDGYFFFPVYQYYDRTSGDIRSILPKTLADGTPMMPEVPRPGRDIPTISFENKPAGLFSPFAALIVTNDTNRGAYLLQGSSRKTNKNGTTMINPGSETYELNLQKQPALEIGPLHVDLGLGASSYVDIPAYTYQAGYNYQVRITSAGSKPEIKVLGKSDDSDLSISLANER